MFGKFFLMIDMMGVVTVGGVEEILSLQWIFDCLLLLFS
jgi:hypothetical protein